MSGSFIPPPFSPLCFRRRSSGGECAFLFLPAMFNGQLLDQSEPGPLLAMDCTAAILKACARSRPKCCRVEPPWRSSSALQRLLLHVCCWVDGPVEESQRGGRGAEEEGEAEFMVLLGHQNISSDFLLQTNQI